MKVLFWSETFWPQVGGVERLATGLLTALRDLGHQFEVVTWTNGDAHTGGSFRGMPIHPFGFFAGSQEDGAHRVLRHVEEVRQLKRAFAPDLVHVNSLGRSVWFHLATNAAAAPTLVTLHQPLDAGATTRDSVAGRLLGTASWIACCSRAILASVRRWAPAVESRTSVIVNALPAEPAVAAPPAIDPPHLLFVGRLVAEKGLDRLLSALPALFVRKPNARLTVAGSGPLREALEVQAAALRLDTHVRFIGEVAPEAVRGLMREASIVIVPSRVEGFGLVALEAALCGRPVVATRVGGLLEVVQEGTTGMLVDADDPSQLVSAIERLLDEPQLARRLGEAARNSAADRFDWQRHVHAYDNLYRRLASHA